MKDLRILNERKQVYQEMTKTYEPKIEICDKLMDCFVIFENKNFIVKTFLKKFLFCLRLNSTMRKISELLVLFVRIDKKTPKNF